MTQQDGALPYGSGDQPPPTGGPGTGPVQQPSYEQASYEQAPYEQAPYGQAPYAQPSYEQAPYGQAAYAQSGYGQPAHGQPPYGQPPYGQVPYGQPYPGPYGPVPGYPYAPPQRTNGMAIASLVLGIVWVYWVGSILALVFGYIARNQIRQRGEAGAGMATAGIVLGWIGVGMFVLVMIVGIASYS